MCLYTHSWCEFSSHRYSRTCSSDRGWRLPSKCMAANHAVAKQEGSHARKLAAATSMFSLLLLPQAHRQQRQLNNQQRRGTCCRHKPPQACPTLACLSLYRVHPSQCQLHPSQCHLPASQENGQTT
eukprot:GHRQ01036917.1.p2 GENE.GHRQ01036917.1~~GHRQ01036917.1.p2  ORF type:complete len:126 (+),score=20.02 GHRQ01036917.1:273-650(+)